jgi:hypothetical protein
MLEANGLAVVGSFAATGDVSMPAGLTTVGAILTAVNAATGGSSDAPAWISCGNANPGKRQPFARLTVVGTDSANQTVTADIYAVVGKPDFNFNVSTAECICDYLGECVFTLGTATGLSGSAFIDNSFRFADTVAFTAGVHATAIEDALNGPVAESSDANNRVGWLLISDTGNAVALLVVLKNQAGSKVSKVVYEMNV